ncbi:adenylate/guanylate cyclase domain-containing protein [Fulvivirga sp. M361]|uniref:adenylate/guanylate cyclase domain-containing protein n=1 Tax=Fulvivirga sp. M361 TaxID=2594266 RepID=UPI00117BC586|nr:adenylate/guanylate cyclase domain-containing protein [Fulvivirga sp. M361]TRX60095.1 adenylate/guanylate cyclase domain-containing protein [Fulvivirga sp. M361]
MKLINKRRWQIIKTYCIGWTLAFVFLSIVRGVGTTEMGSVKFDLWTSLLISITTGPVFGAISGYAQILTEERIYKRLSIQRLLVLRVIYAFFFLIILLVVFYVICTLFLGLNLGLLEFATEPGSFPIYFYILSVDFFMAVLRQVNLLIGDNNFSKLLQGKFYTPREEERVFMFLDLQSSTQLAERLGHIDYSRMIQDCFNDLGVVVENEAEIYQYVGDEVILTWQLQDGLRRQNCINAYFNFKRQLDKKKEYYLKEYNCQPFFKAGMNAGIVTVTEVGKYKKEIAYHGDTINTAARIQAKCNDFGQELLISEYLKDKLDANGFVFDRLGKIDLKGKTNGVFVYAASEDDGRS